jgi:hypothetical protein
MVLEEG